MHFTGIHRHKIGDTFSGSLSLPAGVASEIDYTDWDVESQIRRQNGDLLADLTCSWIDRAAPIIGVRFAGSTDDWPAEHVNWDIQFVTPNGDKASSQTMKIELIEDVTR